MSKESAETLAAYETNAKEYITQYPCHNSDFVDSWIEKSLQNIAKNAEVLEIGSGTGIAAKFIENLGYKIQVSDAAESFVKYLQENGFPNARYFNVITDEFWQNFDYVLADAVLLHFTKGEVKETIKKVYDALNPGGTFAFSLMLGDGEKWQNRLGAERFFKFWQVDDIVTVLEKIGFDYKTEITGNYNDRSSTRRWITIIVHKSEEK